MDGFVPVAGPFEDDPNVRLLCEPPSNDPFAPPPLPFGWSDWPRDMDEAAFLAFLETRPDDEKWELWDGVPRMMNPPSWRHQSVASRMVSLLDDHFYDRDDSYMALHEVGLRIGKHPTFRPEPDFAVLERGEEGDPYFNRFILAGEVLSPSNTYGEIATKVERYRDHPDCRYVLVLEQHEPSLVLHTRGNEWTERTIFGADAVLELPTFSFSVRLSSIYRRVIGS